MAYKIISLDGTTDPVSSDYPWGNLKNAPGGTRVNKKMLGDVMQLLAKMMNNASIVPSDTPDNVSNGYQLFQALSFFANDVVAPIVINLIGNSYDASKVYILHGCADRFFAGVAFYNGLIYYVDPNSGPLCALGTVDLFSIQTSYFGSLPVMKIGCGVSGSGAADFADAIYINKWREAGALTFGVSSGGGSITVAPGDIKYNRYMVRGNTVTYQLRIRNATTTSALAFITVNTTFLPGLSVVNDISKQCAGVYNNAPAIIEIISGVGGTSFKFTPFGGFIYTAGAENFDINVTYEIE